MAEKSDLPKRDPGKGPKIGGSKPGRKAGDPDAPTTGDSADKGSGNGNAKEKDGS